GEEEAEHRRPTPASISAPAHRLAHPEGTRGPFSRASHNKSSSIAAVGGRAPDSTPMLSTRRWSPRSGPLRSGGGGGEGQGVGGDRACAAGEREGGTGPGDVAMGVPQPDGSEGRALHRRGDQPDPAVAEEELGPQRGQGLKGQADQLAIHVAAEGG